MMEGMMPSILGDDRFCGPWPGYGIIDEIQKLSRGYKRVFLREFDIADLQAFLDRLKK